jgi:putative transposase
MRTLRFTEEPIIGTLKLAETGMKAPDVCRQFGMTETTHYRRKSRFGGRSSEDASRLEALEARIDVSSRW